MNTKAFARKFFLSFAAFAATACSAAAAIIGIFEAMNWLYSLGLPSWAVATIPMVVFGVVLSAFVAWKTSKAGGRRP